MENIVLNFNKKQFKLFLRDEADQSVMREIFKLREYKAAEAVIAAATDPVIDAGAHAGFFCLYCRALNPEVPIVALEPEPKNREWLEKQMKENGIKKVKVLPLALAGKSGDRELILSNDTHNHRLAEADNDDESNLAVKAISLPDLCRQEKIKRAALLKMDIEGGEYEVLEGLKDADFRLFKTVILEYHNSTGGDNRAIEQRLREAGFGASRFPSRFDKTMGFIFANNKKI